MADQRTNLEQVIQTAIDTALKETHTCLPALVTKVDGQIINCQPTIQRKLSGNLVNLPLLVNVPIRYLKTKTFSISIPIEIEDHVLVIFAERSIDNWLINGGIQNPFDIRKHHLSDAFAFPMMYPQIDQIPEFDNTNLVIKQNSGDTQIILKKTGGIDIIGDINLTGNIQMTGDISGANVFNGAKSNDHIHPQGADSAGDTQQNTEISQ